MIERLAIRALCVLVLCLAASHSRAAEPAEAPRADVVVYGGTPAGIAAAVAASREGASVLLLEPTRHVGGLHTSGLSVAEWAQNRDTFGGILDELFRRLGRAYGSKDRKYEWESKVAERVYNEMLREARVTVALGKPIDGVEKRGARIVAVTTSDGSRYAGRAFIDASYEGDLMARAGVSYAVGREAREQYGDPLAGIRLDPKPVDAPPYDDRGDLLPDVTGPIDAIGPEGAGDKKVMVYNFRVILKYVGDSNPRPLPRPERYDPARYRMLAGVLRSRPDIKLDDLFYLPARPNGKVELNNRQDATVSLGLLGAQHDWPEASHERRREIWQAYKDYTLGYLYYLANEPTVPPAVQKRMRQFALPDDEFADNGNWPYQIYVREARRMVGPSVMVQRDIQDDRDKPDSIGLGSHWLDCHHAQRLAVSKTQFRNEGRFWIDLKNRPYEIPYRSLTPRQAECDNLLVPVCLSSSHVAFSSIRVEEVWMMLGQAAGTAAVIAARHDQPVQAVDVQRLRSRLRIAGLYFDRAMFEPPAGAAAQEPTRPAMTDGEPAPGQFVRQQSEEYRGTGVHHGLYLPANWEPGKAYPVIVEYAPNRWEELTGKVEDCRMGFHLSGGRDFIWVVFPYVDPVKKENVVWWWGSEDATIEYCLTNLRRICERYGGDPNAILFTGFSRGAIAAGYLALRNDAIADVWLGFIPHSHIDGGRFTEQGARGRLARTRGRPTFVTYGSDDDGKNESPKGARILRELGNPVVERELAGLKHTDQFLEKDSLVRREMRAWVADVLKHRPGTCAVNGRVIDAGGKGMPGVTVQCGGWHRAVTDAEGRYAIPSLTPGKRKLTASKAGVTFSIPVAEVTVADRDVQVEPIIARVASAEAGELRVGVAQPLVVPGDVERNVREMEPLVIEAARRGARLVVFSECGITGYDLKGVGAKAAITLEDPALAKVARMAREHKVAIATGFYEKRGESLFNSAAVFFPDGKRVVQRKHNVLAPEKAVAAVVAAERERTVFRIDGVECALLICAGAGIPGIFDELSGSGCDAVILICAGAGDESFGMHQADLADPARRKDYAQSVVRCLDPAAVEQCLRLDMAQVACNQAGWDSASGYFHPGGSSIIDRTGDVTAVVPPNLIFERLRPELAVGLISARTKEMKE